MTLEEYRNNHLGEEITLIEDPPLKYKIIDIFKDDKRVIRARIRFALTGYEYDTLVSRALNGEVKDPYYPNNCGVACMGIPGEFDSREYSVWSRMISRCYSESDNDYNTYGAKGITVCKDWLCFEFFLKDFRKMENYDKWLNKEDKYEFDKDLLQQNKPIGERIYSPETCCLITKKENSSMINNPNKSKIMSSHVGERYESDCGWYEIIADLESTKTNSGTTRNVRIKFDNTGYEKDITYKAAKNSEATDPYFPTISGVGYRGEPVNFNLTRNRKEYECWKNMIHNCYDEDMVVSKSYKYYGAVGVTVCERWHCFANFLNDIRQMKNFDKWLNSKNDYIFSKDYMQIDICYGNRVYSPETCCFVHRDCMIPMPNINPALLEREYDGISYIDDKYSAHYRCRLFVRGQVILDEVFFNPYHAAIYHDYYAQYYGAPVTNNVPIDDKAFYEAQRYRGGPRNNTYPYAQMYHLVDNGNNDGIDDI